MHIRGCVRIILRRIRGVIEAKKAVSKGIREKAKQAPTD